VGGLAYLPMLGILRQRHGRALVRAVRPRPRLPQARERKTEMSGPPRGPSQFFAPAPGAEQFECPSCGPRVAVDEDGCCATCGGDTVIAKRCCAGMWTDDRTFSHLLSCGTAERPCPKCGHDNHVNGLHSCSSPATAGELTREVLDDGYPKVMTDEEITDALWDCPGGYSPEGVAVQRQITALRVALAQKTEECERLTRLAACPPVVTRELARARKGRDKAEGERDALRRIIEEVPHERNCPLFLLPGFVFVRVVPRECNCWKSKARAKEGK
jgi:hypothetical protein